MTQTPPIVEADAARLFMGGGEMGALMRSVDWSETAVGPIAAWPQSLRTAISMMLDSSFAMVVAWGPEFRFFYNDSYRPVLGATKHPGALGTPAQITFPEAWAFIGPLFNKTRDGESIALHDVLIPLDRNGFLEDCYFTLSYSPIRDESGGVGGMLAVVAETTARVQGERRMGTLRDLLRAAGEARSIEAACENAARILDDNRIDVPFALLYLVENNGTLARLISSSGVDRDSSSCPPSIDCTADASGGWPVGRALRSRKREVVSDLATFPAGSFPESVHTAMVVALAKPGQVHPFAVLITGVSPTCAFDDAYEGFIDLAADHILSGIANARAFQDERDRADVLAQIDRVKTAFFNNVSHEFRTPLTLMLGPTEDVLAGVHGALTGAQHDQIATIRRNALRLLKLVNTLLDFARLEAGRIEASYEPTDLAQLTTELASVFRSAIERAGIALRVDCDRLAEPVYVDREMWEKIVLNLVSNAFKFTFEGEIAVTLRATGDTVELSVRDTGSGIPPEHLPDLFKRFHRVQGARSRTHEGSGIGLALVHELVGLHGGGVSVVSALGVGTTFTVRIPTGHGHLPTERVDAKAIAPATHGAAFVGEAMRWLPTPEQSTQPVSSPTEPSAYRILIADDNADLRAYVAGLLAPHYIVEAVADGQQALEAAVRRAPDLILSDVMMPVLDGRGLLREIRGNDVTRAIPVILLSARAGEEATVEGLDAGADDYLQKPFSSRELLARVRTHLEMARIRREFVEHQRIEQGLRVAMKMRDDFLALASHEFRTPLTTLGLQLDSMLRALREAPDTIGPLLVQRAEKVRHQANRLEQLVGSMLDVFSLDSSSLELKPEPIELGAVARAVVEKFRHGSRHAYAQLKVRTETVTGVWDRARVEQVMTSLIENALKFGATQPIDVVIDGTRDEARILIRDRGIGIAAKDQERIFERFERAVSQDQYGGFGLGLWVVRGLVQAMNGSVRVESAEGAGASFVVTLPGRR